MNIWSPDVERSQVPAEVMPGVDDVKEIRVPGVMLDGKV